MTNEDYMQPQLRWAAQTRADAGAPAGMMTDGRPVSNGELAVVARRLIQRRRLRDSILGPTLLAEPGWDILLELMLAELKGTQLSKSVIGFEAAIPTTTALRWIQRLEEEGLVEHSRDPRDRRRSFVRLTSQGSVQMQRFLSMIATSL